MGGIGSKLLAALLIAVVFVVCGWVLWRGAQPTLGPSDRPIQAGDAGNMTTTRKPAPPKDWLHFDSDNGFSFYAPFATGHDRLHGIDSACGRISNPRFRLEYEFGFYSPRYDGMRDAPDYSEDHIRIDGRAAVVRRTKIRDPQTGWHYWIALYVPKAEWRWVLGPDGTWAALSIAGTAASEEDRRTVEQLFSTITFDRPLPANIQE